MKFRPFLLITLGIYLVSCEPKDPNVDPKTGDIIIQEVVPDGSEKYLTTNSDYIFNQ